MIKKRGPSGILRLLIACVIGSIVTGLSLASAWQTGRSYYLLRDDQLVTHRRIGRIDTALKQHYVQTHSVPRTLDALRTVPGHDKNLDEPDVLKDRWGRPFLYSIQGKTWRILSYGRDGKPGGSSLDADLSNADRDLPEPGLSFRDFRNQPGAGPMILVCLAAGALSFVLSWIIAEPTDLDRASLVVIVLKLTITLVLTAATAAFMAMLDLPSGH